jgi:hypothetical protein
MKYRHNAARSRNKTMAASLDIRSPLPYSPIRTSSRALAYEGKSAFLFSSSCLFDDDVTQTIRLSMIANNELKICGRKH